MKYARAMATARVSIVLWLLFKYVKFLDAQIGDVHPTSGGDVHFTNTVPSMLALQLKSGALS